MTEKRLPRVYEHDDYKSYLRAVIQAEPRGIIRHLAEAAGCQRSYFSQALGSHINLTSEQLFGVSHFLNLSQPEAEYLMLLLERDKAARQAYKAHLAVRIKDARDAALQLSARLAGDATERFPHWEQYYSSWHYAALHLATSVATLNTEAEFAKYLNLPLATVSLALKELEDWGLVAHQSDRWNFVQRPDLYLGQESALLKLHHHNWRTFFQVRPEKPQSDLHYTSVFAIAKADFLKLREDVIAFIESQRKVVQESGSEEVCVFCCDLTAVRNAGLSI